MTEFVIITRSELEQLFADFGERIATSVINRLHSKKPATYTRKQAAAELGVSPGTITNMIRTGRLHTTADGSFIPLTEISKYLNKNNCQGNAGMQPGPLLPTT